MTDRVLVKGVALGLPSFLLQPCLRTAPFCPLAAAAFTTVKKKSRLDPPWWKTLWTLLCAKSLWAPLGGDSQTQ